MEEVVGSSVPQAEPEAGEPEKVYGKPREEEPTNKITVVEKKFRYQILILTMPEIDDTLSKLLGTMVSVSFQTMLQVSPRLLKGLRQLLTRRRVKIDENPESSEEEREEEAPQEVANLQRSRRDLEDLEKAFADIRVSLPDREDGEVMRAPPGTKLSFHALPVGKLKILIGTHHTDALVDGEAEITLIRRDFATITGCTVNKEVTRSIRGAGGEISFVGYVRKCAIKAGVRESMWSFQRMTVMEKMDHDIILGRPWCANIEMIGMHLHDGTYMVDIEDPVTGRGELLRLLGMGGDPSKGKLATWSPSFEDCARKGAFARMEGVRERVEIMIEEAFNKKEWIKMGLPQKHRRQEDEVLGVMVAERESEVELRASLPKGKEVCMDVSEVALEIPDLLQLIKAIRYHNVGVDSAALAKFEGEVQKGYCMNGKLVSIQPRVVEVTMLDVIQAMHDGLAGGHRSSKGTLAKITPLYYWPGMAGMVAYCQTCLICQERNSVRVFESVRPTWVLGPGHLVHLDLAVMPVSTDRYRYILNARDNLSGFVEAVALKKRTGRSVADWIKDFYLRHPFVRRFIADNEIEFVNQEVLEMLKRLCVPIKLIEPYHPKANAPVERGHRTLKNTIAKLAANHLGSWPRYLKQVVFSENMTPKRTTECIPTKLWYGKKIDFLVEALIPTWNRLDDDLRVITTKLIEARCQQVLKNEGVMEDIANRVPDNRMRDKARWNQVKNVRKEPLQVGETVLLRNSALESTWSGQLGRRFKGPYRVAKRVGWNTFELEDLDGTGLKGPFPRQRLVRFLSRNPVEQWLREAKDKETEGLQAKN
ncbi:hypothetical protein CBR_g31370 [Chara braunii]|uniref:Integrase catalytic domain-containing protein n=1 Tax=Chara braunii TaxID=69332 RepID=A0A388LET2_CHABU|nr:hypothetical protein CBR_g31370 [Chara braunii]|eukprot:GBG80814.1 hypothetical protein CBR_g31370 [Chara braunii]